MDKAEMIDVNQKRSMRLSKTTLLNVVPFVGLIFVVLLFTIATKGQLLNSKNMAIILNQSFTLIVVSTGAVFLCAHGSLDMGYGAVLSFCGLTTVFAAPLVPWPVAFLVSILTGFACYLLVGLVVTRLNVPPFVASMCVKYICLGIVQTVLTANGTLIPSSMFKLDNWGFKISVLVMVFIIAYILLEYTKIGKANKAAGGNRATAAQSGLDPKKYILLAYMITGIFVGVAAFFTLCRNGSANSTSGTGLELNVLTAVVLGGLRLSGGAKAKIKCAFIGGCTIAVLINGLVLVGASTGLAQGIQGMIFLATVYISYEKRKDALLE